MAGMLDVLIHFLLTTLGGHNYSKVDTVVIPI